MPEKIRLQYEKLGIDGYYQTHGSNYRNPHEKQIHALLEQIRPQLDLARVLDLACGSGEVTLKLLEFGAKVEGIDPYTGAAYLERTGQTAQAISFEDLANGALEGQRYSFIVCSVALHLVPISRLALLCYQLGQISSSLLVLTPHKRPILKPEWGWRLEQELFFERIRARLYRMR